MNLGYMYIIFENVLFLVLISFIFSVTKKNRNCKKETGFLPFCSFVYILTGLLTFFSIRYFLILFMYLLTLSSSPAFSDRKSILLRLRLLRVSSCFSSVQRFLRSTSSSHLFLTPFDLSDTDQQLSSSSLGLFLIILS